jgi:hypothetical protein
MPFQYRRHRLWGGGGGFLRMSEGEGAVQENLVQTVQAVFASTVPKFSHFTITCGHNQVNHTDLYNVLLLWHMRLWRGRDKRLNTSQLIYETKQFFHWSWVASSDVSLRYVGTLAGSQNSCLAIAPVHARVGSCIY